MMLNAFCSYGVDSPFLHLNFVDSTSVVHVREHSIGVDPELPESVCAFYDFSIEGNC